MWSTKNSQTLLTGMQSVTATLENSLAVYYKGKQPPTLSPLLGFYPREMKTHFHTKTYMLFLAAFFLADTIVSVRELGNRQLNFGTSIHWNNNQQQKGANADAHS